MPIQNNVILGNWRVNSAYLMYAAKNEAVLYEHEVELKHVSLFNVYKQTHAIFF